MKRWMQTTKSSKTMEYGLWNFHGGLWPASSFATFSGATLTPIAALPTCADSATFALTAGLLANPLVNATESTNTQQTDEVSEPNSASNSSEPATNDEDPASRSGDSNTPTTNDTCQFTSDLSNACDDNAVDNHIKIESQIGFLAQQYAPVYNLVLGHLTGQNNLNNISDSDDSSDNDTMHDDHNNGTQTSKDATKSEQPSKSGETNCKSKLNNDVHKCPVAGCEFKATQIDILEKHVASHSEKGSKNKKGTNMQRIRYEREEYHCTMCPYTCTTERAYLRHLRLHSLGEAPHGRLSCAVCGRDRAGESAMARHMRKHRDDRYFCCDICVFRTVQLKKLIQHRRMHTGEKPHLCPHCTYRSARRDNLRSHVRRVHKRDNIWCDTFSPRGMLLAPSSVKGLPTNDETPTAQTNDEKTSTN